jgi:hypothetical protein
MKNEKFVGFMILGTKNQEEAVQGKGLMLWTQEKPSWLNRFYNKLFLGIRWVDKVDYDIAQASMKLNTLIQDVEKTKVEMPKQRNYKKKPAQNGSVKENTNTTRRSTSDKKQE